MKIVQSCWSCKRENFFESSAGWYSQEYHIMSWALSCLQLRKYYNDVTIYADEVSAEVLLGVLKLPYTNVICELDCLNGYHNDLWALPKIHVYAQQKESFLHVDGDVFIWEPFSDELTQGALIAQNIEAATKYYNSVLEKVQHKLKYFPAEMLAENYNKDVIYAFNAGIFGGTDLDFIKMYADKAKMFVDRNKNELKNFEVGTFNVLFEQYLFYLLVKSNNKAVNVLIPEIIGDNGYIGLGDFTKVPFERRYLHLLGSFKKSKFVCEHMANRLRLDFPEYYYRIISLLKNRDINLKKKYYSYYNKPTEEFLIRKYRILKNAYMAGEIFLEKVDTPKSFASTKSRVDMVINRLREIDQENCDQPSKYQSYISDILSFEQKLSGILNGNFSNISTDYLYARDIFHTQCFEEIFGDKDFGYSKKLVVDQFAELIENRFDWSNLYIDEYIKLGIPSHLAPKPSKVYTVVIPECDFEGCSLFKVDELDLMLLKLFESPKSLNEILIEIQSAFDPTDINESSAEFELLIMGRIKKALRYKLIKLAYPAMKSKLIDN